MHAFDLKRFHLSTKLDDLLEKLFFLFTSSSIVIVWNVSKLLLATMLIVCTIISYFASIVCWCVYTGSTRKIRGIGGVGGGGH